MDSIPPPPSPRGRKRRSDQISSSPDSPDRIHGNRSPTPPAGMSVSRIPTKAATDEDGRGSPSKKRRTGITLAQKQALIDNLQLEITERARKLRAQYNLQAQSLRTRVEIRINRVPRALRKMKMGDLISKYEREQQLKAAAAAAPANPSKGSPRPPVPEKDMVASSSRPTILHNSNDKENHASASPSKISGPTPKCPAVYHASPECIPHDARAKVLSPTTANTRMLLRATDRAGSPVKSMVARPAVPSPTKPQAHMATNLLSSMVEKARATRATTTAAHKVTVTSTSTTTSSTSTRPAPTTKASTAIRKHAATAPHARRGRATPAAGTVAAPAARPASRAITRAAASTRRTTVASESSEASTATVVRKRPAKGPAAGAPPPAAKRTVMSTIKKGVAGAAARKTAASKVAAALDASGTTMTGRVLRRRK